MTIRYVDGDATAPEETDGPRLIVHVVNDAGAWGAGFTRALSARWAQPEAVFRIRYRESFGGREGPPALGTVQVAIIRNDPGALYVVNMIAQEGLPSRERPTPLRYDALAECLHHVLRLARLAAPPGRASVHMPRIGCGLAGGNWAIVERLILRELVLSGVPVVVYDLPKGAP